MATNIPVQQYLVDALPVEANRTPRSVYFVKDDTIAGRCKAFVVGATVDVVREVAQPIMAVDINNTPPHDPALPYEENTFVSHAGELYFNPLPEGPSGFSAAKWVAVDPGQPWLLSHTMADNQATRWPHPAGLWTQASARKFEVVHEGSGRRVEMKNDGFSFYNAAGLRRQIGANFESLLSNLAITGDSVREYIFKKINVRVDNGDVDRYIAAQVAGSFITKKQFDGVLGDAGSDGKLYARKDGAWVAVPASPDMALYRALIDQDVIDAAQQTAIDARLTDAGSDGKLYARKDGAWVAVPAFMQFDPVLRQYKDASGVPIPHVVYRKNDVEFQLFHYMSSLRMYRTSGNNPSTYTKPEGFHWLADEVGKESAQLSWFDSVGGLQLSFSESAEGGTKKFFGISGAQAAAYNAAVTDNSFITKKHVDDYALTLKKFKSYGHQLTANFNGYMGDASNFPGWNFTRERVAEVGASGGFKRSGYITTLAEDIIPISLARKYRLSFDVLLKGSGWALANNTLFYLFTDFYDAAGARIASSTTPIHPSVHLTAAPVAGATVIETEAYAAINDNAHTPLLVYPYSSAVMDYGTVDYSRQYISNSTAYDDVNQFDYAATIADPANNGANDIVRWHLKTPLSAAAPVIALAAADLSSVRIAQMVYGGTYLYTNNIANSNGLIAGYNANTDPAVHAQWHNVSWELDGLGNWVPGKAPPGTAGIRIAGLFNYPNSDNKETFITNVMVEEIT